MRRRKLVGTAAPDRHELLGSHIPMTSLVQLIAVAKSLNFRHAAAALGVSQSSVSTRIRMLEEDLGVILFERRHRGVRLTEAGQRFTAQVSVGIDHLDHAIRTAGAISDGVEGQLAMGLHSSIATGFLADLRRRYRSTYPRIEHVIVEGRSSETIAQVRDGKLDITFVVGAFDAPDCHSRQLWTEQFAIALPEDHDLVLAPSVTWAELASETFLVRNSGTGPQVFDHVVRRIAERKRSPHIQRFDVGRDTLMHMVAAGDGITLTSETATHVPFPGIVFRQIMDETEQALFSAVWSPHNRSPAFRNLLDLANQMSRSAQAG